MYDYFIRYGFLILILCLLSFSYLYRSLSDESDVGKDL